MGDTNLSLLVGLLFLISESATRREDFCLFTTKAKGEISSVLFFLIAVDRKT